MPGFGINPGEMRTRITFQTPTITKDAGGAQVEAYANVGTNPTVWARWINAHGQEVVQSESLQFSQRATVMVRHRTDIVPTWQILKGSEIWQILSVDGVQGRNRWVELIVERVKGSV